MAKIYGQLERAQLENLSSDPTAALAGRIFYNTTSTIPKYDTGSLIKTFVDTDSVQALTNKDYDGGTASNTSRMTVPSGTTAALTALTRKAGTIVYSTDEQTFLVDNGTSLEAIGGGGGSGFTYIDDNFEGGITDWSTPSTGLSVAAETTSEEIGSQSLKLSKDAADRSGGYWERATVTIDPGFQHTMTQVKAIISTSANYVDNDAQFVLYDEENGVELAVIPEGIPAGDHVHYTGYVQTAAFGGGGSQGQYSLRVKVNSTNATAYDIIIDNVRWGETSLSSVTPVTDWKSSTDFSVTWGTSSETFFWRRVGDELECHWMVVLDGTSISSIFRVNMPSWARIDYDKIPSAVSAGHLHAGTASTFDNSNSNREDSAINVASTTVGGEHPMRMRVYPATSGNTLAIWAGNELVEATNPYTFVANDGLRGYFRVPVKGWGSNITTGEIDSHRLRASRANGNFAQGMTSGTEYFMAFATSEYDEDGAQTVGTAVSTTTNTTNWKYVAKESGLFNLDGALSFDTSNSWDTNETIQIRVKVNNVIKNQIREAGHGSSVNTVTILPFSSQLKLVKGDRVEISVIHDCVTSIVTQSTSDRNFIAIHKVMAPSQPLAGEKVYCHYNSNNGQTIDSASDDTVIYEDIVDDSHSSYNVSTGVFTAPKSAQYFVSAKFQYATQAWTAGDIYRIKIVKGSSTEIHTKINEIEATQTIVLSNEISGMVSLAKGETIKIVAYNGATSGAATLSTIGSYNTISIFNIN